MMGSTEVWCLAKAQTETGDFFDTDDGQKMGGTTEDPLSLEGTILVEPVTTTHAQ